ncbi:class I adenylate-forming enzyme family protein [Phenylobacterium sp.]|uniref:class I adenylate-forming enzyme family protein n=1 Tax=Phenylobacterium sp. TaxID=1871053 RepID=UPI002DF3820F|nr:class I adenylate-forming enzyme family protein [Phenylobacterium sp.]
MSRLADLIEGVLRVDPQANALEHAGRWRTWGELDGVIGALDAALNEAGLGEGVRVAAMLRNHPLTAAALLGLVAKNRCVVTLNPSLPDVRLAADIEALRPPVVVGLETDWARAEVRDAALATGCLGLVLIDDPDAPVRPAPGLETVRGQDLNREAPGVAIEMLTSGTTGAPKRIPLKTATFEQAILDAGVFDGRKPGDPPRLRPGVQILNAPFAHIGGVFSLFNCVSAGRQGCLLDRFTVEGFVDAVRRHRPKVASAPPSALRMILDAQAPKEDLASLVAFRAGTAPLDPDLADEFYERYAIPVLQNYGATEFAGGVAGWTLADFRAHPKDKRGSVGRVMPGISARIVDPQSGAALPFGHEGLLELKARHLGDGKSWLRTTDLAVLDSDNFLWIKGRFDNAIIRGGFKVLPDDVVRVLEQHPAIREAAVVALPDARLGQVPAAAYTIRGGSAAPAVEEIRSFLRERLLPYQVPVRLLQVSELPRTPSLKVSQPDLKALFEAAAS